MADMSLSIGRTELLSGNMEAVGSVNWESIGANGDGTGLSTAVAGKDHVSSIVKSKLC
jgi:hypothetical protein